MQDQDLYNEEILSVNKEISKRLEGSAIIPIPQLPKKMKAEIVNKVTAEIEGKVDLNDSPFKELGKDLNEGITLLVKAVVESIEKNKPDNEVTVKNIDNAKSKEVRITNLDKIEKNILELTETVIKTRPVINVQKQEVTFPSSARDAIPVRLSDGKSFYNAIISAVGGGSPAAFKDSNGKITQVRLTADGSVPVSGGGSGGTQYTEGDIDTSFTGNMLMFESGTDEAGVVSDDLPLPVILNSTSTVQLQGSVDIASVITGVGATNLGKAEDALHTSGDVGVMALGVRNNTPSALATNGDYIPFTTGTLGEQWVGLATLIAGEDQTNNVMAVNQKPVASSAYTGTSFIAVLNDVDISVKATPGNILSIYASNLNAAVRYLQIFNKASAPAGGDTAVFTWPIPVTTGTVSVGRDFFGQHGHHFPTGIAVGVSTAAATFTAATTTDHIVQGTYV